MQAAVSHGAAGFADPGGANLDPLLAIVIGEMQPRAQASQVEIPIERFVQLENTARSGRGLGLAFCKAAVEAHGGQIWIEDAMPGARFCVRFPDV